MFEEAAMLVLISSKLMAAVTIGENTILNTCNDEYISWGSRGGPRKAVNTDIRPY